MFYEQTVLTGGTHVLSERIEGSRSVALGFWVRTGNRDESPQIAGISHFMEHMLFKGTPTRSALDISLAADSVGAELNAFTSREYTCFYSRVIDEYLPDVFEVLADMLVNASFDSDALDLERKVVLEEIAASVDTPEEQVYDVFADAMFPTHPLGRPVLGTAVSVGALDSAAMHAYHDSRYTTGNVYVVACGNVDHDALVALTQRHLAGLNEGPRLERNDEAETKRKRFGCIVKDTEQAHLLYGFPSVSADSEKRFALSILSAVMGGSMSSRLFQEVREKRGLVYSVYTASQLHEDAGCFLMYAGTRPDNIEQVVDVARSQFAQVASDGIAPEELERAVKLVCGSFVLGMESTRMRMTRLGRLATCGLPLPSIEETLERYKAVSCTDVAAVASDLFAQEPTACVISPRRQEELEGILV